MVTQKNKGLNAQFEKFASAVTKITGSSISFFLAVIIIIVWAIIGPLFNFSDTWQLVINTGTTIVTFLMVFVIQQTQNKDSMALQLKLNELIACEEKASNRLIDIEDLSQEELETIKKFYIKLASLAKKEQDLHTSHSVDEANDQHARKLKTRKEKVAHPGSK